MLKAQLPVAKGNSQLQVSLQDLWGSSRMVSYPAFLKHCLHTLLEADRLPTDCKPQLIAASQVSKGFVQGATSWFLQWELGKNSCHLQRATSPSQRIVLCYSWALVLNSPDFILFKFCHYSKVIHGQAKNKKILKITSLKCSCKGHLTLLKDTFSPSLPVLNSSQIRCEVPGVSTSPKHTDMGSRLPVPTHLKSPSFAYPEDQQQANSGNQGYCGTGSAQWHIKWQELQVLVDE